MWCLQYNNMAMEMGNIELMVKLQVFTYIHDQHSIAVCLFTPLGINYKSWVDLHYAVLATNESTSLPHH